MSAPLEPQVYRSAAELRAELRRFSRRSEEICRRHGLTERQYTLLLMIKGAPDGSERSTVTELAARLQLMQSTVTELVGRAVAAELVEREPSAEDGRVVYLRLSERGERVLAAAVVEIGPERRHLAELVAALPEQRAY